MLSARDRRRYESKVDGSNPDACWPWTGGVNSSGYGQFGLRYRMVSAHRIAFALAHSDVPPGLVVMHLCDNRPRSRRQGAKP